MGRRTFNAKEHITYLNIIRIQFAETTFNSSTIRNAFKSCGIPSNLVFWSEFCKSGLVKKINTDTYSFTNSRTPVHFHKLNTIYEEYKKKVDIYHERQNEKQVEKKEAGNILNDKDINDAIRLLLQNGFTVSIDISKLNI